MSRRPFAEAVAAAMTFGTIQAASAQSASDFNVDNVVAACTQQAGNGCLAAVQAYIAAARSNVTVEVVDELIVHLVVALGANASELTPEIRTQIAKVIVVAAGEMNDPELAESVVAVASDVEAGVM